MQARSGVSVIKSSLSFGIMLLLMGGAAAVKAQVNNDSKVMEGSLTTAYKTESTAIPPIDAAAPSDVQTASFGLG
jgi:ABC-type oligopeptide transport system substrate-binding subunit